MGEVQLDHVEAGRVRHLGRPHEGVAHPVHVGAVHGARGLTAVRERERRRREDLPVRFAEVLVAFQERVSEPLRPACASWIATLESLFAWMKSTTRFQAPTCSGEYMPAQCRLMRPSGSTRSSR